MEVVTHYTLQCKPWHYRREEVGTEEGIEGRGIKARAKIEPTRTLVSHMPTSSRHVVITGIGAVSGFGLGLPALWAGLVEGRSSLARLTRFDPSGFPCRLGAEVPSFAGKDHVPKYYRKAVKVMARDTELAVAASKLAVEDAGLFTRAHVADPDAVTVEEAAKFTHKPKRFGCHIGAGLIAADTEELSLALATAKAGGETPGAATVLGGVDLNAWGRGGMENLTPLWLLKYLPNMLACHVTIIHGAEGPSNTITCAEASGLLSIGESMRVIRRGAAEACFAGGAESKISLMGLLRMDLAGRVAHTGDSTDGASFVRPYEATGANDVTRGGLLGEGGGILILEEGETAAARRASGAKVYAECLGFGAGHSSPWYEDAESDEGLRFAIEAALEDAKVKPNEIDAIVPMALGVDSMDRAEFGVLSGVFGSRLAEIPLVTIAANVGNCNAGAGGLQAAVAAKCLAEQRLPARLHAGMPRAGIAAGATASRAANLRRVLVCTGSLGGQNAALVLGNAPTI